MRATRKIFQQGLPAALAALCACSEADLDEQRRPLAPDEVRQILDRLPETGTVQASLRASLRTTPPEQLGDSDRLFDVLVVTDGREDAALTAESMRLSPRMHLRRTHLSELEELASGDGVLRLAELGRAHTLLDQSLVEIGADQVHSDYTGEGVLVGIIDSGIDLDHADFLDDDGETRIRFLWDPAATEEDLASLPEGLDAPEWTDLDQDFTGDGYECERADILAGDCPHHDRTGHGTHVTSIAAGDGSASSGKYTGVAPDAELAIVAVTDEEGNGSFTDIVLGASYVRARAAELGMPFVINISMGNAYGPHDGCSDVDVVMDEIIQGAEGDAEAVVVAAAGNSADKEIHATTSLAAGDEYALQVEMDDGKREIKLDIWHDDPEVLTVEVCDPYDECSDELAAGTGASVVIDDGGLEVDNNLNLLSATACEGVEKGHIEVHFLANVDDSSDELAPGTWTVTLRASDDLEGTETVHAWLSDKDLSFLADTSAENTITSPASTPDVIAVGSYVTSDPVDALWTECWLYGCDSPEGLYELADSSSRGPLLDDAGTQKPEISAPGKWIRAAEEHDGWYLLNYVYKEGTSMASPHVAGAVALMLDKNGALSLEEIREALEASAAEAGTTAPDDNWGWGKLDAADAVELVPESSEEPAALSCALDPEAVLAGGEATLRVSVVDADGLGVDAEVTVSASVTSGSSSASLGSSSEDTDGGAAEFTLTATSTPGDVEISATATDLTGCSATLEVISSSGPTSVTSDISSDTTWTLDGSPYELTRDLVIERGATLIIEPGVTVHPGSGDDIFVDGTLIAAGTASSPITFESTTTASGSWGGVVIKADDVPQSVLEHVIFRYGGQTSYAEDYPLYVHPYADPALADLTFEDNRINAVAIPGGTWEVDVAFNDPGVTYLIMGDVDIDPGATLTIDAGSQIKLWSAVDILVHGGLIAEGTSRDPIVFTSYRDDDHWEDADGGGGTSGVSGDWGSIWFTGADGVGRTRLRHVELHYAGADSYAEDFPLRMSGYANPVLEDVELYESYPAAMVLDDGTYERDVHLHTLGGLPYWTEGDIAIASSATLTIDPGVGFKMDENHDLIIDGALKAVGVEGAPIIFTSYRDDDTWGGHQRRRRLQRLRWRLGRDPALRGAGRCGD